MAEYSRIQSVSEIGDLIAKSHDKPVIFFKHSLTCPISGAGFRQYESFLEGRPADDDGIYTLIEIQRA